MDNFGRARITDFGLALVIQGLNSTWSASSHGSHAPRWTAPEVLNGGVYSKKSDVFSFAMVMIEVRHERLSCQSLVYCGSASAQAFTGAVPFNGVPGVAAVHEIMNGERPPRPHHPIFTTKLWELMQCCWDDDPHVRPRVSEVLRVLRGV